MKLSLAVLLVGPLLVAAQRGEYGGPDQQRDGAPDQQDQRQPSEGPVGGPAPPDAVHKAKLRFLRLYNEAAARAAAAPDIDGPDPSRRPASQQEYYPGPAPRRVYRGPQPVYQDQRQVYQGPQQVYQDQQQVYQGPQQVYQDQRQVYHGPQPAYQDPQQVYRDPFSQQQGLQPAAPRFQQQFLAPRRQPPAFSGPPPPPVPEYRYGQQYRPAPPAARPTYPPAETDPLAGPPEPVTDTPEVAAAKAAFHRQYRALAARAAASDPYARPYPQPLFSPGGAGA